MENKDAQKNDKITVRSLIIGAIFVVIFAYLTVYFENYKGMTITATQISPLPFILMILMLVVLNPICRLLRVVRGFSLSEVLTIFVMGSVSAGISTFGLVSSMVPFTGSLFNEYWNTDQAQWDKYVEPFINDAYFVAAPGIQEAAQEYYQAEKEWRHLSTALDKASVYKEAAKLFQAKKQGEYISPDKLQGQKTVEQRFRETKREWLEYKEEYGLPEAEEVVASFPERVAEQKEIVEEKAAILSEREQPAFDKVTTFRRGLPGEMRAFPGFVPTGGESWEMYKARLGRLRNGMKAHDHLQAAVERLKENKDQGISTEAAKEEIAVKIEQAVSLLGEAETRESAEKRADVLRNRYERLTDLLVSLEGKRKELRSEKRGMPTGEARKIESRISNLSDQITDTEEKRGEIRQGLERIEQEVIINERISKTIQNLKSVASTFEEPGRLEAGAVKATISKLNNIRGSFVKLDASLRRFLIGDVPWGVWLKPLTLWGIIFMLTYIVMMSFNVLIFRQWAHNERLSYPMAQLPQIIAGNTHEDEPNRMTPALMRSGLFWVGFAIAGAVMGWNLFAGSGVASGFDPINLTFGFGSYVRNTAFSPLGGRVGQAQVYFTLIGLAFLVPANISFSLWFFYILFLVQLLVLCWLGFGAGAGSFPKEWYYTFNFRTAEGGGALLVFSMVVLFKCRTYLLCVFSPQSVADLEAPERKELRISSFMFIFGALALILMLTHLGVHIFYSIFGFVVLLAITIGLVRAVTEGGIISFQAWTNPFHFIRSTVGMDHAWTHPTLYSPLMIYVAMMFLDMKAFIAPSMANAIKIRDDVKAGRLRFHIAVWTSIVLALVAATAFHLMFAYDRGADAMNAWFYDVFPKGAFSRIANMTQNLPVDESGTFWWVLVGALVMGALIFFRQRVFWLPHPIGMIMLINPLMRAYWFSIFIAWGARTLITKFGNQDTYYVARKFFVGLIVGELTMIGIQIVCIYLFDIDPAITLNRQ